MAAALPIVASVIGGIGLGAALPGVIGGQADPTADFPVFPEETPSSIDDEIATQTDRNRALRRQAASRSRSLTNIQDNPITEDSLLRLLSED